MLVGFILIAKVGASSGGQYLFPMADRKSLQFTAAGISVPDSMGIDDASLPNPGLFTIGGELNDFDVLSCCHRCGLNTRRSSVSATR